MYTKKQITIFLFITTIGFLGFKSNIQSTQFGQYRGEGYNFFNPLGEWVIERQYLLANIPAQLRQAYAAQGVNLDRVEFNDAVIKIWGATLDASPADRIYNVVFHPDVQRWRGSDADFNTNLLVGLFDPQGVVPVGVEGVPFNTFGQINISKHDQIYYSPNNGRFQIQMGRRIASFWTAALSEDRRQTVVQFNLIIDDLEWARLAADYIRMEAQGTIDQALDARDDLIAQINTPADRQTFDAAIAMIDLLEGLEPVSEGEEEHAAQPAPAPAPAPAPQAGGQAPATQEGPFTFEGTSYPDAPFPSGNSEIGRLWLDINAVDSLTGETFRALLQEANGENRPLVVALVYVNTPSATGTANYSWRVYDAATLNDLIRTSPTGSLRDPETRSNVPVNQIRYFALNPNSTELRDLGLASVPQVMRQVERLIYGSNEAFQQHVAEQRRVQEQADAERRRQEVEQNSLAAMQTLAAGLSPADAERIAREQAQRLAEFERQRQQGASPTAAPTQPSAQTATAQQSTQAQNAAERERLILDAINRISRGESTAGAQMARLALGAQGLYITLTPAEEERLRAAERAQRATEIDQAVARIGAGTGNLNIEIARLNTIRQSRANQPTFGTQQYQIITADEMQRLTAAAAAVQAALSQGPTPPAPTPAPAPQAPQTTLPANEKPFQRTEPFQSGAVPLGRFVNGRPVLDLNSEDVLSQERFNELLNANGRLVVALVSLSNRDDRGVTHYSYQIYSGADFMNYLATVRNSWVVILTDPATRSPIDLNSIEYYVLNSPSATAFTSIGKADDMAAVDRARALAQPAQTAPTPATPASTQPTAQEQAARQQAAAARAAQLARQQAAAAREEQLAQQQRRVQAEELADAVRNIGRGSPLRTERQRILDARLIRGERQELAGAEMAALNRAEEQYRASQATQTASAQAELVRQAAERTRQEVERAQQEQQRQAADRARQAAQQQEAERLRQEAERARQEAQRQAAERARQAAQPQTQPQRPAGSVVVPAPANLEEDIASHEAQRAAALRNLLGED